ncbi:hypothetical protein CK203_103213 [Vitis vinifera]|uniref:Uncharacterized protein n=1 Tax=Vitis vinifera TaxID=29760 RepID=A0A438FHB5_VITVI|nr:hypothetical protein CK203_103213 [Vitis vinifera]
MVVEESIHVIFYESNNSLQERESFDDDLGLETSMGKLQIEDRRQQEEVVEDSKKEESPLALPPPQQVQEFSKCMHSEFEMSMIGELNFFLGLQIKQLKERTFINQAKYIRDLLKRFNMEEAKTMKTPMSSSIKLDMDEKGKPVNSTMYRGMIGLFSSISGRLGFRVSGCFFLFAFILSLDSFSSFVSLDGTKERDWHLQGSGQAPAEPSQPEQTEARRKGRFDTALFSSNEDYQRYKKKFAQKKVVPGRNVNFSQLQHFGFEGLFRRMGWLLVVTISEPIFPTLSICRILDIPSIGLRVYEAKAWPTVPGFEPREAVKRLYGLVDPQGMGKPSAHSLTVTSRVLHHMICSILLPRGGHRDEVSYLEAFIVDSILTGRRIHVGYLMMMHMISCVESSTRVLPYGRFLTRVFKDVGVDLSRETDFEAPTSYDTKAERQAQGHDQIHPGVEEEAEIREMEDGLDPQRDFEQRGPELDIPPPHQSEAFMLRLPSPSL